MKLDFNEAPLLAVWETTRACSLACGHCRAEAITTRDAAELSTEEGKRLLSDVSSLGGLIVILSGGDCLNRTDLEEIVAHGKGIGLRLHASPAATPLATRERLLGLRTAGLDGVIFALDGPDAAAHDSFRKAPGSFDQTLSSVRLAREAGLRVTVSTCIAEWNYRHLEGMIGLTTSLGLSCWDVYFLVPVGRLSSLRGISAQDFEDAFERLHKLSLEAPYAVKLAEAQHFKRYVLEKRSRGAFLRRQASPAEGGGEAPDQAVNAGKGLVFIDHVGNICPSRLLPLAAGNIRTHPLAETYRGAHPFRELRDPKLLKGRCGVCEYAELCSGSRARAWAVTGDFLETDPFCAYTPKAMRIASQAAG
ncbi:MAG: radical SAM protein [Elusimicrobia bacterium]|nr:radical SAM protein [Elusimicrobiota bacterium]